MRRFLALISLVLSATSSAWAQRSGYFVATDSADGGWSAVFDAVGYRSAPATSASLFVVRQGAAGKIPDLEKLVQDGAYVIFEGASPAAARFGFTTTGDSVITRRELDARIPDQMIFWRTAIRIPRASLGAASKVFSKDKWSGAPLLAGRRLGKGAVLWAAVSPGTNGFDHLPYVTQALADLGMQPRFLGNRVQAFFDYSYRTRADPTYLAVQWRRMGITRLFVSSWYFYERDADRDKYLATLVDAAHKNGITVYAWLELPHVSEQFWAAHPEWREKNGKLGDAVIDWRKLMNMFNDKSFSAVSSLVTGLLDKFDWDGVTLSELYFEGTGGVELPTSNTPFNDEVRQEVRTRYGFDPGQLFDSSSAGFWRNKPENLQVFRNYRMELQRRLHERFLDVLVGVRKAKGSFGITVCYVDDVSEPRMRNFIGADVRNLIPVLVARDATLLVQDPFELWHLGPDRYKRISAEYKPLMAYDRVAIDINIVTRKVSTFPTQHQTGNEFFQLVHTGQREFSSVSLYAENSILEPDVPLLPAALAVVDAFEARPDSSVTVSARHGVGVRWTGGAVVDGNPWPYSVGNVVWLPNGQHTIARAPATAAPPHTKLLDFNGELDSLALTPRGLSFQYSTDARAIAIVDHKPLQTMVDNVLTDLKTLVRPGGFVVLLPGGKHRVEITTR